MSVVAARHPVSASADLDDGIRRQAARRLHAKLDYNCATFLSGAVARCVFDGYRDSYKSVHGRQPSEDKLGYLAVVTVAGSRDEAFQRAAKMKGYFDTSMRLDPQFRNTPRILFRWRKSSA